MNNENMAIDASKLIEAETLSIDEIEKLLPHLDDIISWANQVKAHALELALEGNEFKEYKVVEGRAYRKITDQIAAADRLMNAGYAESIIYEKKLLSAAKLEKLLGKHNYAKLVADYVEVPPGKPTLVHISDKRKPMESLNTAVSDFK